MTSTVSASPTWAMISGGRRRADSSCRWALPARRSTRQMEGGVLVEIALHPPRRVGEDRRDLGNELRPRRLVGRQRGEPRGERLHLDPDLEQFGDVARRQPPNDRAAMWRVLDQSFGGKAAQRSRTGPRLTEKRSVSALSISRAPGCSRWARMSQRRPSTIWATVAPCGGAPPRRRGAALFVSPPIDPWTPRARSLPASRQHAAE